MSPLSAAHGGEGDGEGKGPFQVHPGHPFGGLLLTDHERTAVAICGCGGVLGRAEAVFKPCSECAGTGGTGGEAPCRRCGGTGEVVDHAALEWRRAGDETGGATW
jgi:hypothetical protein